jgi:hypothetical protein
MRIWSSQRFSDTARVGAEIASAAWRRFLCGPIGSMELVRWVAAWAAYAFLALLSVATVLRERPHQVTLWWLFLLAWLASNVASSAREQKQHDPRAWVLVTLVFLISGMALQSAWHSIGLILLIAAAIHSWPVEWAVVLVQRFAGWVTATLMWIGAWRLLTNLCLVAFEPAIRAANPRGVGVLGAVMSEVSIVLSAGAAVLVLWLLLHAYRQVSEQQEAVT